MAALAFPRPLLPPPLLFGWWQTPTSPTPNPKPSPSKPSPHLPPPPLKKKGGISKTDLRSFLQWGAAHLGLPELAAVEAAPPTAELEPLREGVKPQARWRR